MDPGFIPVRAICPHCGRPADWTLFWPYRMQKWEIGYICRAPLLPHVWTVEMEPKEPSAAGEG